MRIHYMSDVHLEFGALEKPLPKGDVVILAGDITLLAAIDPGQDGRQRARRSQEHAAILRGGAAQLRQSGLPDGQP